MQNLPTWLVHYFAAWNAHDAAEMRAQLADTFTATTRYLDPKRSTIGIDAFVACLLEFRAASPAARISLASGLDAHHHLCRYAWRLEVNGRTLEGYDVVELDASGTSMLAVLSFFGPLP
ncbi:nuclear transport factor 2 family protein [Piscinibacter terrae]|uniref:Nuclear transport factor 2 family protein n=1 Tax=Piscinibacter terrae TaxID=2496871 RepID=A0A3N7HPS3_9BURK|nr:nuclear transport factor 2 family protein [Albitalea terrae]RQP24218.1 nuclear transport factor 2 family protein [Albitalea terrae]